MFKQYLINARLYSCVDVIFLGLLAKFSVTNTLTFDLFDLIVAASMASLRFFSSLLLELKHNYTYRGEISLSIILPLIFFPILIGIKYNYTSLAVTAATMLFISFYLSKNKGGLIGINNMLLRGMVQLCYFVYASTIYGSGSWPNKQFILGIIIFLIYSARGLVADLRDAVHNSEMGKQTFPVAFGLIKSRILVLLFLIIASFIQYMYFKSILSIIPILIYMSGIFIYQNSYVLHQLMIMTTMFFHISTITLLTGNNLIFINLIYLGIFLNQIFYPILKRKSNPTFIQENELSLP